MIIAYHGGEMGSKAFGAFSFGGICGRSFLQDRDEGESGDKPFTLYRSSRLA